MDAPPSEPDTRPPSEWESLTHRFVVDRHEGYVIVAAENGRPVHLEIRMAKAGGVLRGLLDSLAVSVCLGLERGVPLSDYVAALAHARFEPAGWTREMGYASSVVDYVFRWLQARFPRADAIDPVDPTQPLEVRDGDTCPTCGTAVTWDPGAPCPECGQLVQPARLGGQPEGPQLAAPPPPPGKPLASTRPPG